MTGWQHEPLSRIFIFLLASLIVAACSDGGSGESEAVTERTTQETGDWQVASEAATESTLERGQRLFQMCTGCHGLNEGEISPAGPSLYRIAGRRVGSLDSYPYTQAMINKTEYWTVKRFNDFVASPQDAYPGNGMAYSGLKNDEDRAALIAYVATKSLKP